MWSYPLGGLTPTEAQDPAGDGLGESGFVPRSAQGRAGRILETRAREGLSGRYRPVEDERESPRQRECTSQPKAGKRQGALHRP